MEAPIYDLNASEQVSGAHLAETFAIDVPIGYFWFLLSFDLECA